MDNTTFKSQDFLGKFSFLCVSCNNSLDSYDHFSARSKVNTRVTV